MKLAKGVTPSYLFKLTEIRMSVNQSCVNDKIKYNYFDTTTTTTKTTTTQQ